MIKFIAALIGYYLLRFPGAILGYLIGSFIENVQTGDVERKTFDRSGRDGQTGFSRSFLVLTAAVLRADGTVTKNELEFVKELYKQNFGIDKTREDMLLLRDILQGEIHWEAACMNVNSFMVKTERVKLIHYLFGIAKADGNVSYNELSIIQKIAQRIHLSQWDFETIRMRFTGTYSQDYRDTYSGGSGYARPKEDPYKELSLQPGATDDEIKSMYRKLARQYHPDKHASKSQEEQKAAEEKFKKIQTAYNEIKKERGL